MYSEKEIIIMYQSCISLAEVVDVTRGLMFLLIRGEQFYGQTITKMADVTNRRLIKRLKGNL